jgi:hypothetical protein
MTDALEEVKEEKGGKGLGRCHVSKRFRIRR